MDSVKDILDDAEVFTNQLKEDEPKDDAGDQQIPDQPKDTKPQKRSNANRASTTDPDSRMSVKPGKVTGRITLASLVSIPQVILLPV